DTAGSAATRASDPYGPALATWRDRAGGQADASSLGARARTERPVPPPTVRPRRSAMSTRLVEGASKLLATRFDRRGFFGRAAVAEHPVNYVLKPMGAYGAICNCSGRNCDCGASCCDGYTEFCCTIYGQNSCPPGTITAGWWKVDGSNFCGGGPRYYMDCNSG